ncbi:hypothetical protein M5689_024771 [Euphorbia peplus]|nr:hypothetical protein M5689_024771 [Euphorbia peplus]
MVGYNYTWEKSRGTSNLLEEKLDRGLATPDWLHLFPSAKILNEEAHCSDHSALVLLPLLKSGVMHRRFRFEYAWIRK